MSRIHLTIGIIALAIMIVAGLLTELLRPFEAILFGAMLILVSPFLFILLRRIPKHDPEDRSPLIK
ncbi:MAG TPA: hypothetical protein VIK89_00700 [Cytophagaceae bacterium]